MQNSNDNPQTDLRRLVAIIESSADAILAATSQGIITEWNAAAERMYGYSAEEAIGKSIEIIAPADLLENSRSNTATAKHGNYVQHQETIRQHKDGTLIDVDMTIWPIVNENGEVLGLSAIHRDISERKRIEVALSESEKRYELVIAGTRDGIWERNFLTGRVYRSPRFFEILGYEEEGLDPSTEAFYELLLPEDAERCKRAVLTHFKTRAPFDFVGEFQIRHKSGKNIWISVNAQAEWDEDGKPARMAGSISDITERKLADDALRESESRYELAIAGMSDGIWERDLLNGETYHSSRWFEILGYEPDGFDPDFEAFKQSLHPEDADSCLAALQAHLERGVPFDTEYRIRHKSGEYVWVSAKGQAAWDDDGNPVKMAGSICDISERKRSEEALRKNEGQLRAIIEYAPLILNLKDLDGRFSMVNSRYAEAIGLSVEDIIGKTSHETVSKKFADEIVRIDQEVIATGEVKRVELVREEDGGTEIIRENIKFPIMGPDGDVIAVGGVGLDITERKRTEEALQKNEARIRILADAASDWFWETDGNFVLTWFSFDDHPITGAPASSLIGHRMWMWAGVEMEDSPAWSRQLGKLIKDRKPFRNFVMRIKFSEFGTYDINVSGVPKFDENGTFTGYYGASADVTRQATAEDQLRQAQKLEAVGQLTGGVAHDFNNLLAATMTNAQILELKLKGHDDLQTLANSIIKSVERGSELTHRLLAFSRNQTLQPKSVQLGLPVRGNEGPAGTQPG